MHTYKYQCRKCDHELKMSQQMKDKPLERWPVCSDQLVRLISKGGGIILKGTGF